MKRDYQITIEWGVVDNSDGVKKHLVWRQDPSASESIQCEDNFNALREALTERMERYAAPTRIAEWQSGMEALGQLDTCVDVYRDVYYDLCLSMIAMTNSRESPGRFVRLTIRKDLMAWVEEMLNNKEVSK